MSNLRKQARYCSQGLYFIQAIDGPNLIKIGYSYNADKRIRNLQIGSPVPLCVLGVISGTRQDEKDWHQRWIHCREHGEWFTPTPALLNAIERAFKEHDDGEPYCSVLPPIDQEALRAAINRVRG